MNLVHDLLKDPASSLPDKTAVQIDRRALTFRDLDRDSDLIANALREHGLSRGDRVAVILDTSPELVLAFWGVLKAGGVFVPIAPTVADRQLAFLLEDTAAAYIVAPCKSSGRIDAVTAELASVRGVVWTGGNPPSSGLSLERILEAPHRAPRETGLIDQDLCLIIYTSGSTGRPKGVMMTHRNIRNNIAAISEYLGTNETDVILSVLPLTYSYGLFQILSGVHARCTVVLEPSFAFPHDVMKRIGEYGVTVLPGVPTFFSALLGLAPFDGLDFSSLKTLTNAAAAIPVPHLRRLRELIPGARIFSMYGLTECTRVSYLDPALIERKPESVGRAMPNTEVFIVDGDGRPVEPGETGELVVRGSGIMRGYWQRPDETADALRPGPVDGEKVLYTGDLFRMDSDGDLYFAGRRDDIFKCRGEKISPREIENCLYEIEDIAEASVVGLPDEADGMAIGAFVVPREARSLDVREIRKHCRMHLGANRVPKIVEVCDSLPRTASGKIKAKELRSMNVSLGNASDMTEG